MTLSACSARPGHSLPAPLRVTFWAERGGTRPPSDRARSSGYARSPSACCFGWPPVAELLQSSSLWPPSPWESSWLAGGRSSVRCGVRAELRHRSASPDSAAPLRARPCAGAALEVLPRIGDGVDGAARLSALVGGDQRPDEDDPLALLARDLGPVVGVSGVRQILVLRELVQAGLQQVANPHAFGARVQEVLDRHLLGSVDDVLDHGAGVEVLEVQDLLVAAGVGDFEELVLLGLLVHPGHRTLDHPGHSRLVIMMELGQILAMQRKRWRQVLAEDFPRRLGVGPFDLDLDVQPTGTQDRRVDHVLAVGGADDDHVVQAFDAVDLAEQLWHDRALDVGGHARSAGAEDRVHLVEEDDDRRPLAGLLPGALEHQPDVPLGLADVLVQQLRALDVQEERLALVRVAVTAQ